jgi:hypothetical protein
MARELLTASRMNTLLACPRKHYFRYEIGLVPETNAPALRFGSAFHAAMEARWRGMTYEDALKCALGNAERFTELDAATLSGLLAGYYAYYRGGREPVRQVEPETQFRIPLERSRSFESAGKIDGIGLLADGRACLLEHKTSGEDISPASDYWMRLRFNPQIYQYVHAARSLGHDVSTIIYDVTRKPSIRQRQNESVEEYASRLAADTQERPEFYFARREVPVLEDDLAQFMEQRLNIGRMILHFRASAKKRTPPERAWPRNCGGMTCRACDYSGFCLSNVSVDPGNPPAGFRAGVFNPELRCETGQAD